MANHSVIDRVTRVITRILSIFLMALMAIIVLDVTWQVITRFILKNPSSFTEELAGFLLIWIGVLGASYALHTKSHLGIDVLTYKLKGRKKQVIEVMVYTIILFFALFIMVVGGIRLVGLTFSLKQVSAAMGIPIGYVYLVLPLSGALMIYYSLIAIVQAVRMKGILETTHQVSSLD